MRKFTIGSEERAGVFKLQEECAELSVVLAKLVTVNGGEYWDGRDLDAELIEELGDVLAAADYFMNFAPAGVTTEVLDRKAKKLKLFHQWHEENYPGGEET